MQQVKFDLESAKNKVALAFSTVKRKDVNFAYELYDIILQQEEKNRSALFQFICELWGTVSSSEEIEAPIIINQSQYDQLELLYGEIVNATLSSYIKLAQLKAWTREEFYSNFWKAINSNPLWENKEEKAFVLYYVFIDVRTPYFNIGSGLKMNNDDISHIQDEIFEAIREFQFIVSIDYSQKTEKASLILNLIDRMNTNEQKVVLIARIITYYEQREKNYWKK